jgi:ribosome modulation factor
MSAKVVWGGQPGKERGGMSRSEDAYIKAAQVAANLGVAAALNPRRSEADCPFTDDRRTYWLDAFRRERARP